MKISLNRNSIITICGLVVFAALVILLGPRPQLVDIAKIERGRLRVTVDSDGRTRIRNVFAVPATITGYMERIPFKPGDSVAKDAVLTRIYPPEPDLLPTRNQAAQEARIRNAEAQLDLANSDVERVRAALEFARADWVRKSLLHKAGYAAVRTAEEAELEAKSKTAELAVVQKTVQVRKEQVAMERASLISPSSDIRSRTDNSRFVQVSSPITGLILKVTRESADIINSGAPLVEVGDPHDLEIMLEMLSTDAVKVRAGAPAVIDGWGGGVLNARVRKIEPAGFTKVSALGVEEQRVVIVLDFTDPPEKWQVMSHGYRIDAKILVWESDGVLKIPTGALFRVKNDWTAYVVANGIALARKIVIGHANAVEAEVMEGVNEGETVILHPSDQIYEGGRVEPRTSR